MKYIPKIRDLKFFLEINMDLRLRGDNKKYNLMRKERVRWVLKARRKNILKGTY